MANVIFCGFAEYVNLKKYVFIRIKTKKQVFNYDNMAKFKARLE